jgi:hypothetical protein
LVRVLKRIRFLLFVFHNHFNGMMVFYALAGVMKQVGYGKKLFVEHKGEQSFVKNVLESCHECRLAGR